MGLRTNSPTKQTHLKTSQRFFFLTQEKNIGRLRYNPKKPSRFKFLLTYHLFKQKVRALLKPEVIGNLAGWTSSNLKTGQTNHPCF